MSPSRITPHTARRQTSSFERLLADISTLFINLPADRIDNEIKVAQRRVCELLDLDRSSLFQVFEGETESLLLTHTYQPPGTRIPSERMSLREFFPWAQQKILGGETITISKMTDLPAEAGRDRATFDLFGTRSVVVVPLSVGRRNVFGLLTFAVMREERDWPKAVVQQFKLVAQIFANALARKQAEKSLKERLQFEILLTDISARFVNLPSDQVDGAIEDALCRICECLGLDLAALWQRSDEVPGLFTPNHVYSAEGDIEPSAVNQDHFPWYLQQILSGRIAGFSSLEELPPEAARDRESCGLFGIKSNLTIPLSVGGNPPIGFLGFNTTRAERNWPDALVKRLQLVSQIFANAIARERAERELAQSERRLRMIANALPALIGYIDADQRYRFNNQAYKAWFGFRPEEAAGRTIREVIGDRIYHDIAPHIEKALSGEKVTFSQDVELVDGRHIAVEAIYVPDADQGGVVRGIYTLAVDVSERNQARQESRRLQEELLHAGRLATMGELAGTLAHEINQPLSAIMSNAQAALRFLQVPSPDMEEVQEILGDIVKDDARAGEIINRLRAHLKKTKTVNELLDLNAIHREVLGLLRSNAVIRNVEVSLALDPQLPLVWGDRIQLQQIVLNLMLNALEAMDEPTQGERRVWIRTALQDAQLRSSVTDSGKGIPPGETEAIFDPYYTSKPRGLGLGLSICRTIVKRHQGRIWAETNPEGGATFHFSLPVPVDT